jgi:error-prone DNA polymerase
MVSSLPYTEIAATSNFSFLRGASFPEELIHQAHALSYRAISITDRNSLTGVVRAHSALREISQQEKTDLQLLIGSTVEILPDDSPSNSSQEGNRWMVVIHPTDRVSYGALSELLSLGKSRSSCGDCLLTVRDLLEFDEHFCITALPPELNPKQLHHLQKTFERFQQFLESISTKLQNPPLISLALPHTYGHLSELYKTRIEKISHETGVHLIATNTPLYHIRERKPLHDVLTCIREHTTVLQAGYLITAHGERYLKDPLEMHRLYQEHPALLKRAEELRELASQFSLDHLHYEYPHEVYGADKDPSSYLTDITWRGAQKHFVSGIPGRIKKIISEELSLIRELHYEKYFLTCYDIVCFARSKGILCQGRGAAANSAVCYCLGITSVDPSQIDTLFARFISKERDEPPDIDIDFEHERREEVIQYIYEKYGRQRAALTCEVITYRHRSAIKEVGKALGLPHQTAKRLAKSVHHWTGSSLSDESIRALGLDPKSRILQNTIILSQQLIGFPRHLSQHVGGFIISETPLTQIVPIRHATMKNRTIIEWDKNDIEELGMLKIDILALGMLTCLRKAFQLVNKKRIRQNRQQVQLYSLPQDDQRVYDMICRADTIGVFQIESRAQMSMLPRLRPRCFYDLVIEIAIVRPGPIRGDMVHPYLRRRDGKEQIFYPDERVKRILEKTLSVPLFQEQAMRLAIELADFSPGEAEKLRRAMAAWKRKTSVIALFVAHITEKMTQKGYTKHFIEQCCQQLQGFSEYGFPESHAASFAHLVYASAWLKCHYPMEFATALINSQPMGFYAPAQILDDVRRHGVEIAPIDVNKSRWDLTIQHSHNKEYIQLGFRLIKGLSEEDGKAVSQAVDSYGKFVDLNDFWKKIRLIKKSFSRSTLLTIAQADGFSSLGLSRREALWEIRALPKDPRPLEKRKESLEQIALPGMTPQEEMIRDYETTNLSLRAHPLYFIRPRLQQPCMTSERLQASPNGEYVHTAGLVLFRQRPGTARGVCFITLEDETGMTNLVIFSKVFQQYQRIILSSTILYAEGKLEKVGPVVYITAEKLSSLTTAIEARGEVHVSP